jgi:hypothetical protein
MSTRRDRDALEGRRNANRRLLRELGFPSIPLAELAWISVIAVTGAGVVGAAERTRQRSCPPGHEGWW